MREFLGRTLHDILQTLESADGSEERILRVLELLQRIVPYAQCALFRAQAEPPLLLVPPTSPQMHATLSGKLTHLHRRLVDERTHRREPSAVEREIHLAVPLVGNDETMGVLFVSGAPGGYTEQHLRELAIVGAQLASYLVMVDRARTLDEARREADAANRAKDEFLVLVSHELRTPLTSTLAWARALGSEETDPSARLRAVKGIECNVRAQTKLIDEILELASVVTAGLHLELEAVDPASLIRAAVDEQRPRAELRSIRLETALDGEVKQVVVDRARIAQVISTLLAKAIHFTPDGGQVGVRLECAGAHARIHVVEDLEEFPPEAWPRLLAEAVDVVSIARLAGIAPEVLTLVFETFQAGRDPFTRACGELGVGLAVVNTVVEAHGGRVHAETVVDGRGPTLTVELPLPLAGVLATLARRIPGASGPAIAH